MTKDELIIGSLIHLLPLRTHSVAGGGDRVRIWPLRFAGHTERSVIRQSQRNPTFKARKNGQTARLGRVSFRLCREPGALLFQFDVGQIGLV
jgi:hypothetical protein